MKRQQSKRKRRTAPKHHKLIERGGFLFGHKEKAVKVPKGSLVPKSKPVTIW
jgi:hypothetical protein